MAGVDRAPAAEKKLWGVSEIAEYYAIRRQLAKKWTDHSAFPAPYERLAQGPIWKPEQVIAWGEQHGRCQGAGPGEPKRPRRSPA